MIGKVRVTSSGYDPDGPRVFDTTLGPNAVEPAPEPRRCGPCCAAVGVGPFAAGDRVACHADCGLGGSESLAGVLIGPADVGPGWWRMRPDEPPAWLATGFVTTHEQELERLP